MSEIIVLYILWRYDATIYKISKLIEEMFFAFLRPSLGTINPAVKKLQKEGCLEIAEKMSEGGMEKKICSITPYGRKYLQNALLGLELNNPSQIINYTKIAMFCADVLENSQKEELYKNLKNYLILYSSRTQEALNNEYNNLSETQKKLAQTNVEEAKKILELL